MADGIVKDCKNNIVSYTAHSGIGAFQTAFSVTVLSNFLYAFKNLHFTAGLEQIMADSIFHGHFRIFKFSVTREDNELGVQICFGNPTNQLQTVYSGHSYISQYNIRRFIQDCIIGFQTIFAKAYQFNIILLPIDNCGNGFTYDAFIISNNKF